MTERRIEHGAVTDMEETDAYDLLQRGRELLEGGHPAQAAIVMERARLAEPRKGSILELLGRACYGCGRYSQASDHFQEALHLDPTNDYAHYCLGLCFIKMMRKNEAAGHFKLAWCLSPREIYREKAEKFKAAGAGDALTAPGTH